MRYVPLQYVTVGSYLARPLINEYGSILLNEGVKLTSGLINKIKHHGYYAIYVHDEYSDHEMEEMIKPQLKQRLLTSFQGMMREIYRGAERGRPGKFISMKEEGLRETVKEMVDQLLEQRDVVLNVMDIKRADDYTFLHSVNVMLLSVITGISIGLNRNQLYDLSLGALLHDVGKIFTPEHILKKPGSLTAEEYEVMKEHSMRGYQFLKEYTAFSAVSRIVILQHHERINGSGYPRGLKGAELHLYSKITSIGDVYDALTSDRHYRKALPACEALDYIQGGAELHFDPTLVNAFLQRVNPYPVGTLLRLSNGMIGVVEKVNMGWYQRPVVKILWEENRRVDPWFLDLSLETTVTVEDIVFDIAQ